MSVDIQAEAGPAEPFGADGREAAREDRDPSTGRFRPGNRAALVVGQHSAAFWADVEAVQRARRRALLSDRGHTEDDAPQALLDAVDGVVQAVLLRDSAFLHLAASGGPATLRGRRRAAFNVWLAASDRALRYLQLVGLERKARHVDPLEAVRRAVAEANR